MRIMNIEPRIGSIAYAASGSGSPPARATASTTAAASSTPIRAAYETGRWQMPTSASPAPTSQIAGATPSTTPAATHDAATKIGRRSLRGASECATNAPNTTGSSRSNSRSSSMR
jgi:hypothetical protein